MSQRATWAAPRPSCASSKESAVPAASNTSISPTRSPPPPRAEPAKLSESAAPRTAAPRFVERLATTVVEAGNGSRRRHTAGGGPATRVRASIEVNHAQAALQKCCADNRMPADDNRSGVGAAALLFPGLADAVWIIAEPGRRTGYRQIHIGSLLSEPPRYQRHRHGSIRQPVRLDLGDVDQAAERLGPGMGVLAKGIRPQCAGGLSQRPDPRHLRQRRNL